MKILLVDDEPFALRTLSEMIDGAKDSWEVVATVEDGEEAIKFLQELEVNLVISDIRMPTVDGLELSKYIAENFPNIRVILLTGYKDFEYAQRALQYGVVDYLLKPCSFESLFESIEKIENKIMEEKSLNMLMKKRERAILEKRLDDLLYGIPCPYYDDALMPSFTKILVFTCSLHDNLLIPYEWGETETYTAVKNVAEEWFLPLGETYAIVQEQHLVVMVFLNNYKEQGKQTSYRDMLYSFRKEIQALLKINLIIGVGLLCQNLTELHVHYKESIHAMEHAKQTKFTPINFYVDIAHSNIKVGPLEQKYEGKKNRRIIEIVIEKMKKSLSEDLSLKSLADEVYLNPTYLGRIFKETTGESFSSYLIRLRIEKAKELLKDPKLKIYEVCEQIGYRDPAHFTHVFKKFLGITPQEYKKLVLELRRE